MRAVILAEERIRDLTAEVRALADALARQRKANEELQEAQGFERAMRDRDREELTRLRQALSDERERRIVLEDTLRQTEDRSRAEREALEAQHVAARRELEEHVATAAERLHQVANDTQVLQTHLQNELAAQAAERDRLVQNHLFGYAVVALDGSLVRCNESFARMFGFDSVIDAVAASAGSAMPGLTDHAHVVQELQAGVTLDRVESVVRRANGHPFRVLTSAALLAPEAGERAQIERVFVDLDDRTQIEEQLRLARRLEAAGRLAAEMSGEIESLLPSLAESVALTADQARATTLIRQLIAFSRRQAKPAGVLSLTDAVRRAEPLLRQIAGDAVGLEIRLQDVGAVVAGEDDIEELLSAAVFSAVGSLPGGGTVALETRSAHSGFEEHTELIVRASGYGVQSALVSASLARLVNRCGGTVRVADDPARATTLHIHLP